MGAVTKSYTERLALRLSRLVAPDAQLKTKAKVHLDNLAKPLGSLGRLEEAAAELYAIRGGRLPLTIDPVRMYTVAADHGVAREGVSAYPQDVTRQMVHNFLAGGAAINVLSRSCNIDLRVVDAGCLGGSFPAHPVLLSRRLGNGTASMARESSMSREVCAQGILAGMDLASDAVREGINALGIGEMGIGNTTSATALFAAWLKIPVQKLAGPGTGLNAAGIRRKIAIVEQALARHEKTILAGDALGVLAALGGFEIAIMAGIALGAAEHRRPCLVDGFISQAAWLAARTLCPAVTGFGFVAHVSAEPGSAALLKAAGIRPYLDLGLRLGEGTGAALLVPILRGACALFNEMATFSSADVSDRCCAEGADQESR